MKKITLGGMNRNKKKEFIDVFKKADKDGDGYVSAKELKEVLNANGEKFTQNELKMIFDLIDSNKDGRIDVKEFINGFKDI